MKNEQTNLPAAGLEPGVELLLADAKRTHVDAAQTLVGEDFSERDAAAISAKKGPVRKFTALDDPERKEIEALIKRMSVGDQGALSAFYDRFSATLFGLALRMLKDEMESEDVLQDAFLYIWNKAATYNPELSSPFSWAVMIVRNKAIDRLRSRHRVEKIVERATEEFSHTLDFDARSAEEPFFREQRGIVRSALAKLPTEQRQALNLAFFGGLTHEEIAAHLNTPAGTIKSRIRRGLLELRGLVAEAC
jgi:RNA polymerase sigma-70 factor (ECF subfamily)